MDSNALLDEVKKRRNIASERALARELDTDPSSLRDMRERGLSDERVLQIATLLEMDPSEALAAVHAERAKNPEVKAAWKKVAESMRSALGVVTAVAVITAISPSDAHASVGIATQGHEILCQVVRRWIQGVLRSWKRFLALLGLLTITLSPVYADELRLGVGNNQSHLVGDVVWQQQQSPLPNGIEQTGFVIAAQYIGDTGLSWLKYGIGPTYRQGAQTRKNSVYVTDDCYYAGLYAGGVNNTCDRRYVADRVSTDTTALTLTLNPTWQVSRQFALSAAIGLSFHSTTVEMKWNRSQGVCQTAALCEDQTFSEHGRSLYGELTARYRNFFATAYFAKDEKAPESMADGNFGFFAGLSIAL